MMGIGEIEILRGSKEGQTNARCIYNIGTEYGVYINILPEGGGADFS